ncbi:hypothetical protein FI667_g10170, partial [Globisporangium splendens]
MSMRKTILQNSGASHKSKVNKNPTSSHALEQQQRQELSNRLKSATNMNSIHPVPEPKGATITAATAQKQPSLKMNFPMMPSPPKVTSASTSNGQAHSRGIG